MIPTGIVHYDLTPTNLLLDPDGTVSAVLDFDDCADTALAYDLGPIVGAFGADEDRRPQPDRVAALLAAYHEVRTLTPPEQHHLADLLAIHTAAEGIDVLTGWIHAGNLAADPRESFSMQAFLDITTNRDGIHDAITQRR